VAKLSPAAVDNRLPKSGDRLPPVRLLTSRLEDSTGRPPNRPSTSTEYLFERRPSQARRAS